MYLIATYLLHSYFQIKIVNNLYKIIKCSSITNINISPSLIVDDETKMFPEKADETLK